MSTVARLSIFNLLEKASVAIETKEEFIVRRIKELSKNGITVESALAQVEKEWGEIKNVNETACGKRRINKVGMFLFLLSLSVFIYFIFVDAGFFDNDSPPKSTTVASQTKKTMDTKQVTCVLDYMIENPVDGLASQEMLDGCNILARYLGHPPSYNLLVNTAKVNVVFRANGYDRSVRYTTDKLLGITKLRGQIHSGDNAIINNYDIVFRMYEAWNGDVTPEMVYGFLAHAGKSAKELSDKGLVDMMAVTRASP
ncbi:MAG: hypothetical protein E7E83_11900 [Enterobacter ludwigii]|nr:hypothetical protein [Enterobacter ludwigii]